MPTSPQPAVTLTVTQGPLAGASYEYAERTTVLIGRSKDCAPKLPNDEAHSTISRHHCLFDIAPPSVRVRDFGSLNGTYLNGKRIGRRKPDQSPEEAAADAFAEHDLANGDEIQLGDTVLTVGVRALTRKLLRCAQCGRETGEYVCPDCRARPAKLVQELLERASTGEPGLASIAGYGLVRELGAGGTGRVFLASDAAGTPVTLKVMLPGAAADADARARFQREIALAQTLDHPGIARLRGSGSSAGLFYFTSEYCAGGSLAQLLAETGRLPVGEALRLGMAALEALEYAHARGVVHRDLTPHNILLTAANDPQLKLADFGLAKAFDQAGLSGLTRTGEAAGKPTFVPYQQVVNFGYAAPRVDVWALAACVYQMLTGTTPREFPPGRDPWHVILTTRPTPIRRHRPDLPERLATVLDTALSDQPEIGYSTAAALRQDLQ